MVYSCTFCKKTFDSQVKLVTHQCNTSRYSCLQCIKKTNSLLDTTSPAFKARCTVCHIDFQTIHEMCQHEYTVHSQGTYFECTLCHQTFAVKKRFLWHLHALHKLIHPSKCAECQVNFQNSEMLQTHLNLFHSS